MICLRSELSPQETPTRIEYFIPVTNNQLLLRVSGARRQFKDHVDNSDSDHFQYLIPFRFRKSLDGFCPPHDKSIVTATDEVHQIGTAERLVAPNPNHALSLFRLASPSKRTSHIELESCANVTTSLWPAVACAKLCLEYGTPPAPNFIVGGWARIFFPSISSIYLR